MLISLQYQGLQRNDMESQTSNLRSQIDNSNIKSSNLNIRSYQFSLEIIHFVNELPNKRAFWSIGDQLLRAATSIGANMIEAKASSSRREFVKFYEIALKSGNETVYWLSLLQDSYPELMVHTKKLRSEAQEICNMLGSSIITLKGKKQF